MTSLPSQPSDEPARETFFSLVYNNVTDALFFLGVQPGGAYSFLSINPAFTQITGVPPEAILGKDVREVIPEPSLSLVLARYGQAIQTRATVRWEETSEYPTGTKHGEVSVTPVFDASGICTNLVGVVRDITARRDAEATLEQNRERLEKAQHIAHMGFLDWNLRTNELVCSDEVYRWYGISREEAPKTPEFVARVVHPEDLERTRLGLEAAIRGERPYDLDHRILRPDGRVLWVHAQAELARDAEGNPERLLGTMVDVTERKSAEAEVSRLNEDLERRVAERTSQLEAVNHELASFSYSVSHDLRAPLRHVNGYIDLLRREVEGQVSDKGRRYLQVISDASREMGQLIDDLLAFSRMGRAEMEERICNLDAMVRTTLRELEPATRGRQVAWILPPLPEVIGDASMLKLVFTNLLDNALKFTRPRALARIEIGSAAPENGRLVLFVRDNGVGFDPQYIHKLFGVFQRLHRADEFEGTGIGLANVQRILSRHGGRAWADGTPDGGATFYFTLRPAGPIS
ncbi:MAG TPA: PAS domain S-box protein [Geothrix sp.]|nr:PAS domain S-box protein [Geothrix sp.]